MERKPPFALVIHRTGESPDRETTTTWIGLTTPDHHAIDATAEVMFTGDELYFVSGEGEICEENVVDFGGHMFTLSDSAGSNLNWDDLTEHLPKG